MSECSVDSSYSRMYSKRELAILVDVWTNGRRLRADTNGHKRVSSTFDCLPADQSMAIESIAAVDLAPDFAGWPCVWAYTLPARGKQSPYASVAVRFNALLDKHALLTATFGNTSFQPGFITRDHQQIPWEMISAHSKDLFLATSTMGGEESRDGRFWEQENCNEGKSVKEKLYLTPTLWGQATGNGARTVFEEHCSNYE